MSVISCSIIFRRRRISTDCPSNGQLIITVGASFPGASQQMALLIGTARRGGKRNPVFTICWTFASGVAQTRNCWTCRLLPSCVQHPQAVREISMRVTFCLLTVLSRLPPGYISLNLNGHPPYLPLPFPAEYDTCQKCRRTGLGRAS